MSLILDTRSWKFYAIIIIPAIIMITLLLVMWYPFFTGTPGAPGSSSMQTGHQAAIENKIPGTPGIPGATRAPVTTLSTVNPTLPATVIPTPQGTVVPFSLSVRPLSASARPGDTLTYTLDIQGGEGMTGPIHLSLTAGALFYTKTYDLGDINPPFPKTITYDFQVPGNLPSGITVNGVITASGGGQTESREITLTIG